MEESSDPVFVNKSKSVGGETNFVPLPKKMVGFDMSGFGQAKIGSGQVKPGINCCQHDTMAAWDCLSPL
ncbi:hypothetical protein CKAN_01672100 [Cinnamomum micranthum f. kanehirae]|uniref:Uncharacterized protein n=1 Tax=Cinnamomum micranthum f. kanehirae TaxID=337451 RepID=A0A443PAE7_9MAGN|nr:hypothetical protein CKAN_01672100 [Cinnamomum micranthum f. kanehirae]